MVLFPILYYVFQVGYSIIFIIFYIVAKREGWIIEDEEDVAETLSNSPEKEMESMDMKSNGANKSTTSDGEDNPAFNSAEKPNALT